MPTSSQLKEGLGMYINEWIIEEKWLWEGCCSEFQLVHELCQYVLSISQRPELIRATLSTLHAFLSWIPLGYIFESPLVTICSSTKCLSMQAPKAWPLFQEYLTPIGVVFCPFNLTFSMCTVIENLDYVLELSWSFIWHPSVHLLVQLETLLKLFPVASYRNLSLQCLTEVIFECF